MPPREDYGSNYPEDAAAFERHRVSYSRREELYGEDAPSRAEAETDL